MKASSLSMICIIFLTVICAKTSYCQYKVKNYNPAPRYVPDKYIPPKYIPPHYIPPKTKKDGTYVEGKYDPGGYKPGKYIQGHTIYKKW